MTAPFVIRGAIFDLDGTLLDSMPIWKHFSSAYLRSRGITPPPTLDDDIATYTLAEAAEHLRVTFCLPETQEEILRGFDRTVEALYECVLPKPGARELLSTLRAAGVPVVLATMTDRPVVERTLHRLGLAPFFDRIFTCAEVGARKSSPAIYEAALSHLGTRREETVVFEDAWYAIKTATAAGFPTVAVYDPSGERHWEKASARATLAVYSLLDIRWEAYCR